MDRRLQLLGLLLPAAFATPIGLTWLGARPLIVAAALAVLGLAGATVIWTRLDAGRRAYLTWMYAAAPVGWTVSHLVLAIVYYGVVTPLGLIMRLLGHDPMRRRFDRSAESYWIERGRRRASSDYFRQF
jgi:hypothetical protein